MRLGVGLVTVLVAGVLGGCHKVSGPNESSSAEVTHSSLIGSIKSEPAEESSSSGENEAWSKTQARELAAFMADWQAQMGQTYRGTYSGDSVDYLGYSYPDVLRGMSQTAFVYDLEDQLTWYEDGESGRFVVYAAAVGGQADTATPTLYLFALDTQDDTPVVLRSNTTNGDQLWFYETENTDLAAGFSRILQEVKTGDGKQIAPFSRSGERWTKTEAIAYQQRLDSKVSVYNAAVGSTSPGESLYGLDEATFYSYERTCNLVVTKKMLGDAIDATWSFTKMSNGKTVILIRANGQAVPEVVFYANDSDHLVYDAYHNGEPLVSRNH